MPLRILICPDKFKGTLTAAQAAEAIARGWTRKRPGDALELLPISDGGDGFGEVLGALLGARARQTRTVDAAHRPCLTRWWLQSETKTAIVESARAIGLAMLPPGRFHPFALDTFGLGSVLAAAAQRGAQRCIVGIGGSATNDGGFGMARSLGWRFLDARGRELETWTKLDTLAEIAPPQRRRLFQSLTVAVDVSNPLLGSSGATRVYGPQKGLRPEDFPVAERCLRRLTDVVRPVGARDFSNLPGAGAAGGLGFGLAFFLRARFSPGFDLVAQRGDLARRMRRADLIVTGEGAIDRSTLMGKGVGEIARRCQELSLPCIGLAGTVVRTPQLARRFIQLLALTDLVSPEQSKARAARWLEEATARAAARIV